METGNKFKDSVAYWDAQKKYSIDFNGRAMAKLMESGKVLETDEDQIRYFILKRIMEPSLRDEVEDAEDELKSASITQSRNPEKYEQASSETIRLTHDQFNVYDAQRLISSSSDFFKRYYELTGNFLNHPEYFSGMLGFEEQVKEKLADEAYDSRAREEIGTLYGVIEDWQRQRDMLAK